MPRIKKNGRILLPFLLAVFFIASTGLAAGQTLFGPEKLFIKFWHIHKSNHVFISHDSGNVLLQIRKNTPEKEIRGGFVWYNWDFIPLSDFLKRNDQKWEKQVPLKKVNRLFVYMRGTPGASVTISVIEKETAPPPEITFEAQPDSIRPGQTSTLSWNCEEAQSAEIEPDIGAVDVSGTVEVHPAETTTYTLTAQGPGGESEAECTINVTNQPPSAESLSVSTSEDTPVKVTLSGSDPDEDPLTFSVAKSPVNGSLSGTPPEVTYTPNPDFYGSDTFTFTANDGYTVSDPASVIIEILPVNDPPEAADDLVAADNAPVLIENVLANDTDIDGDVLEISDFSQPLHGAVEAEGNGAFTYTPGADFTGEDSFTYTVTDGNGEQDTASVTVRISPKVQIAASPEMIASGESSVLTWDSSFAESCTISPSIGEVGTEESVTVSPTETTTYTITATGPGGSTTANTTITVIDPAELVFDPVEDQEVIIGEELAFTVHAEYSDDATLFYSASNLPSGASFDPETQTFSWTPEVGQAGEYSPEFMVSDGELTNTMAVHITVTANPPFVTLTADPQAIAPGQSASLSWTSEYAETCTIDPDIGEVPLNGSIDVSPEETTTYALSATGSGGTASDTVTLTVEQSLASITGTITDADTGQPLEGAIVSVEAGGNTYSDETGFDGSYKINGVIPGDIQITVTYSDHSQVYQATLPSGGEYVMDFSMDLSGISVTGTVADVTTEDPLAEATVTAVIDGQTYSANTGVDGSYEISGISENGSLELTGTCPGYLEETATYSVSGSGVLEHDFSLYSESATVTVTGVVTNAKTMLPEPGVEVSTGEQISDTTDSNGVFMLTGVPMGTQRFEFFKADFIEIWKSAEVDEDPFELDVLWPTVNAKSHPPEIAPDATIFVRDAMTGKPLEAARVKVYGTDNEYMTGLDGSCILTGLPLQKITLEAAAENHKAVYMSPTVVSGGADTLTFSLPPLTRGAVSGTITDSQTGEPIRNAQVSLPEGGLLGADSEADGSFILVGIPSGNYELKALHPEYQAETISNIIVSEEETSTVDFTLTPKPGTGSLEGTIRDSQTGEPIAGAVVNVGDTDAMSTTDQQGGYVLSDLPAGLVNISISADGYPDTERKAGVLADRDESTPMTQTADFELDPQDSTPPVSVSREIMASEGGSIEMPDRSFCLVIPPDCLSEDAILTLRSTQDGPQVLPGDELDLDPALGMNGIRALGDKIQLIVEPAISGAEIPSLRGWVMIMSRYSQAAVDAYNVAESSVFPYYWDGDYWTLLRPKPHEMITDTVNNISVAVMDFSTTAAGETVTAAITDKSPVMLASLDDDYTPVLDWAKVYLFIKAGADYIIHPNPPTNVSITDKDELDAVANAKEDNVPNPNALPLLVIEGWDKKTILMNTGPTDPNDNDRYSNLLEDLVNYNNGVYRPVFVSHNSRASMINIGSDLAQKLHGEYLNHPGKIKGLPADQEEEDSGSFSYVNTLGYSFGGLVSRSYQTKSQAVRNMNIIGTPNHGTASFIYEMVTNELNPAGWITKLILHFSPGTADLIEYDDREPWTSTNNPMLYMLNHI
ncbi:MAG: carboxypeptidase regulatory-like domain-containing protein, partial [Desulfosalsimonas sp.]